MAKSKRKKQRIYLTETQKKTREAKTKIVTDIQECLSKYTYIWRIKPEDMRNVYLQQIRGDWRDKGRLFFTKNKLTIKAFGENESEEQSKNLSKFSEKFVGEGGILFTNESVDNVKSYFSEKYFDDYAKTGAIVDKDIILPAGNVKYHNSYEDVLASQEQILKSLEMPVRSEQGCVVLDQDYIVCKYGDRLTAEKAHILKQLGFKLARFRLIPTHYYDKTTSEVIEIN